MITRLVCVAILLIVTAPVGTARAAGTEIYTCDFQVKARCAFGDAGITLARGTVTRVEVGVFWCGPRGAPTYGCTIDSTRDNRDSIWSDDAGATVITNGSPWNPSEPDRIKVTVGAEVSIDLGETQSLGRCGSGAELPQTIVIPAQKGACRVRLRGP